MAAAAIVQLGAWNPVNDNFIQHPASPTGAVIDLNDGVTWSLMDPTNEGTGLDLGNVPPSVLLSGNHRVPGERIPRKNYSTNRHIKATLVLGPFTTYSSLATNLHNLEQLCQGVTQDSPAALKLQPSGSSTPVYADVLECHLVTNYYELETIQLINTHVEIEFICKPFLRGARQWLQNLVWNPGFEAPSGPGVTVFNDPFTNTNAYSIQVGGPLGTDTSTFADAAQTLKPLRYYRLDESSGTTVYDVMHNGDGTAAGGFTQSVAGALTSDTDTAYTFNGTTGTVALPTSGLPTGNAAWSIAAWCKFAANPAANAMIAAFGNNASKSDALLYINSTGHAVVDTNTGPASTSTAALSTGAYHFVVGTWDGTTIALYVDGAATGTPAGSGPLTLAGGYARIAAWQSTATGFFSGQIDEVLICNVALSAANVTTLYNAGHNAPTSNANSITMPANCQIKFGSPAWQAVNQWQVRFRYASGGSFSAYLHYTDANNFLLFQYNTSALGTLGIFHKVGGVLNTLSTVTGVHLAPGAKYWMTVTQFPLASSAVITASMNPQVQVSLAPDTNGALGTTLATVGPVLTSSNTVAISGQPQILAGGATIGVDKNQVSLFGPGGWYLVNTGTAQASGAWDGAGPGGMSGNTGNTYTGGPVTSQGCGRIDGPPVGSWTASWRTGDPTSATTLNQTALPVNTAGDVLGVSVWVKNTTSSVTSVMSINFVEYDSNGNLLRTGANVASVSGAQAAYVQLSGAYTTGASCAYAVLICAASDSTANSASKQFWWDNTQVWDQTLTSMTSQPWCDLRGPQSPYVVTLTGLLGDVPTPAATAFGIFVTSFAPTQNLYLACGGRGIVTQSSQLTGQLLAFGSGQPTVTLDTTAYNGYTVAPSGGTGELDTGSLYSVFNNQGVYHIYARVKSSQTTGNIGNVSVRTNAYNFNTEVYGSLLTPLTIGQTWQVVDIGGYRAPMAQTGGLVDLTASNLIQYAATVWADSTGGGSTLTGNSYALIPLDRTIALATVINPSGGPQTLTTRWFWVLSDPTTDLSKSAWGWAAYNFTGPAATNVAVSAVAPFGLAIPGGNSSVSSYITVNPVADPALWLDPNLNAIQSTGVAGTNHVNQFVTSFTDSAGSVFQLATDWVYTPLYLQPN